MFLRCSAAERSVSKLCCTRLIVVNNGAEALIYVAVQPVLQLWYLMVRLRALWCVFGTCDCQSLSIRRPSSPSVPSPPRSDVFDMLSGVSAAACRSLSCLLWRRDEFPIPHACLSASVCVRARVRSRHMLSSAPSGACRAGDAVHAG